VRHFAVALVVAMLASLLLPACGAGDTSPRSPGPSDAQSCPHGAIVTQADLDQAVYFLETLCPARPQPQSTSIMFTGAVCVNGGSAFEAGRCGFPRDSERALLYYRRGCELGYSVACAASRRLGG
jgi:hypothetical protein